MKPFNKLLIIPFLLMALILNSCQEEGIQILEENPQKAIAANSVVADLIQRTSTRDGSNDNIIDGASCMNIQLPVTVFVNGLEIIIDSEEDFDVIEAIFDELDDDEDSLEIVFPITIILSNYDEVVIETQDQLEIFIDSCGGENEEDDDIECVDFVYPLTYSVFDTNDNIITTVTINSDEDMYNFIHEIEEDDIIALNFPVILFFSDGGQVTANSVQELEDILESAVDFCDEDDDNDYGDDDFELDELNELLVDCPWVIHNMQINNETVSDTYKDYAFQFEENGVVKARRRNGEIVEGTWSTQDSDNGVILILNFDAIADFTLEWHVSELENPKIELHTEEGDSIILTKDCDINFDQTITWIENILKDCFWRVSELEVDGVHYEDQYISTPLKFEDDGVAKLRINGEFVIGTWEINGNGNGFVLQMSFDGRPNLNPTWYIAELEDDKLELENQNNKLELKKACPNADDDIIFINNALIDGTWAVAYAEVNGVDETVNYNNFVLDFLESRRVNLIGNGQEFGGSWMSFRNSDDQLKLALNFMDHNIFSELNNRWRIIEVTNMRIELVDYSDNGSIEKQVVFEKT